MPVRAFLDSDMPSMPTYSQPMNIRFNARQGIS